jgi:hypothetical protein
MGKKEEKTIITSPKSKYFFVSYSLLDITPKRKPPAVKVANIAEKPSKDKKENKEKKKEKMAEVEGIFE